MASEVRLTSGELKTFSFGDTAATTTTANQSSLPLYKSSPYSTFQAVLTSTTFGALAATINIYATNDVWTGTGFVINNCVYTTSNGNVSQSLNQFAGGSEQLNDQFNPKVAVGMLVVGTGIPAGTYVSTFTDNGHIVLSATPTSNSPTTGAPLRFFQNNWLTTALGTITLSGTTSAAAPSVTDGFTTQASWKWVKATVTNISGTGATVNVVMGV